jgi:predicted Zn finger-like uncharacterized protein
VLTRCPSCATHFRVTPEQLKVRGGRVRCGQCQNVFNALDSLIEEPVVIAAPVAAVAVPPAPTFLETPESPQLTGTTASYDSGADSEEETCPAPQPDEITVSPEPAPCVPSGISEPVPEALEELPASPPEPLEEPVAADPEATDHQVVEADATASAPVEAEMVEAVAGQPVAEQLAGDDPAVAETDVPEAASAEEWSSTFPEPPPPPRRWPWVIGSLVALAAIVLQALLAFRVELAVLWPEGKPALVALCEIADCEVGLPAKVGLVGIEASDLHPDSEHKGRLVLAATLKNRAPFAQQFPHLELTLTDTADQAIARKVLAPADYLPPATPVANGMQPNADIMLAIGIDSGEVAASGYRLYLFYP